MNTLGKILDKFDDYKFINSDTLKCLAIITMFIDHIGAGVLLFFVANGHYPLGMDFDQSAQLYHWIRHIGRQAFPIYCFLIVEGLEHTRSISKYLLNLGLFGIISEPAFDLALKVKKDVFSTDIISLLMQNQETKN